MKRTNEEFKMVDDYLKILSEEKAPSPPANLADIIMAKLSGIRPAGYIFDIVKRQALPAAALVAIILIILFNWQRDVARYETEPRFADVADYTGLAEGETKETAKGEVLNFSVRDDLRLSLRPESKLVISRLVLNRDEDKVYLGLALARGSILVASGGADKTDISIDTPQARIRPVGTEFLVSTSADATTVYVKKGNVEATPFFGRQEPFLIGANQKASISADGSRVGPARMSEAELSLFDFPKRIKGIYYEKR